MFRLILFLMSLIITPSIMANNSATMKKERNLISQGNERYAEGNYKEAVESYRKALTVNPLSLPAEFNLASALINLPDKDYDKKNAKPIDEATSLFKQLAGSNNKNIVSKSLFNLGHISYNNKDYASSIDFYKKVLRIEPNNDKARTYLRMAQLKQNENKKDKQQDKEQKKEEKKDQEQNKDQNQDNNQQQNNQQQKNDETSDSQENINDANAERILKSIENKEQETLMRIHQRNKDAQRTDKKASGRYIEKPW